MLRERGVQIHYDSRFDGIVDDNDHGVTFQINGATHHASMLVGADGIFSTVRRYLEPAVQPEYTGTVGALAHIRRDTVNWPYADFEPACTIQGTPGAFFTMPEDPEAHEIMVGMQVRLPEHTRAEWDALAADKEQLCAFFRRGYDEWHDTARQVIDQVCAARESIYLWPFLRMPRLKTWFSGTGRVVILGDAAHAVPPSSGQGVNQALEDVYSFVLLLRTSNARLVDLLRAWQDMRQRRVDAVFDWATNTTNVQRLPKGERDKIIAEGEVSMSSGDNADDMRWLYGVDMGKEVATLSGIKQAE